MLHRNWLVANIDITEQGILVSLC